MNECKFSIQLSQLKFNDWNDISYNLKAFPKTLSWEKNFLYYDKKTDQFYFEQISLPERILRTFFGYKKYLNRKDLYQVLKAKKLLKGPIPAKEKFRPIVGQLLGQLTKKFEAFAEGVKRHKTDSEMLELFNNKVFKANDLVAGGYRTKLDSEHLCIPCCSEEEHRYVDNFSPLGLAIQNSDVKLASRLLQEGADPNGSPGIRRDSFGKITPIMSDNHLKLALNRQLDTIVEALLEKNAMVKEGDNLIFEAFNSRTFTFISIKGHGLRQIHPFNLNLIKNLLKRGYKADDKGAKGYTPLNYVLRNTFRCENVQDHREIVRELLRYGAKPSTEDLLILLTFSLPPDGFEFDVCGKEERSEIRQEHLSLINILLDHGTPVTMDCIQAALKLKAAADVSPANYRGLMDRLVASAPLSAEEICEVEAAITQRTKDLKHQRS